MTTQPVLPPGPWTAVRAAAFCCLLAVATSASYGATVAHWNFETDLIAGSAVDGQTVSHPSASGVHDAALADVSGNGNTLSAWNASWASMGFSNNVDPFTSTGSTLSANDTSTYSGFSTIGDLDLGGNPVGSLTNWTIEASVNFKNVDGWQGIVGVDGNNTGAADANRAPLYFQKVDGTNAFRISYVDAAGNGQSLDSLTTAQTNTWYHVAATSDGSTLRFYVNGVQESSLDLTASANPAFVGFNPAQIGGDIRGWSVMRGMYGGGHGDRMRGYVDDVRISDVALAPNQMLFQAGSSLIAEVNKSTGEITLKNASDDSISFDYYLLETTNGTLSTAGWNSLSDQGIDADNPADFNNSGGPPNSADLAVWQAAYGVSPNADADGDGDSDGRDFLIWQRQYGQTGGPGNGWDEAGGASSAHLSELFLNGSSTLAAGASMSLGNAFNPLVLGAGVDDTALTFKFADAASGSLVTSSVVFVADSLSATTAVPEPASTVAIALAIVAAMGSRSRSGSA